MSGPSAWPLRRRTLEAMAWLCLARLAVAVLPFSWWRRTLGPGPAPRSDPDKARRLAAHLARAAWRLPFATRCLPQAMALSWMLRRRGLDHVLVIAARPPGQRGDEDRLHAWLAVGDQVLLGELPGPWLELYRAPSSRCDEALDI